MQLSVSRPHPTIGAQVHDVDLSGELDEQMFNEFRALLDQHSLLLFRGQKLTPSQFARFSARFGPLRIHEVARFRVPEAPEVTILSNIRDERGEQIGFVDVGHAWHTDASFQREPHMYSFLHSVEIPRENGRALGSTWFVSSAHAYDTLEPELKKKIAGLRGIHRFDHRYEKHKSVTGKDASRDSFKDRGSLPDVVHPVVRTHPVTGRKSIYVNELTMVGIVDMPDSEAQELIGTLCRHCTREEQIYRHQWEVGDVLAWDNCTSQHVAIADYKLPQRRLLYKTTVQGTAPF